MAYMQKLVVSLLCVAFQPLVDASSGTSQCVGGPCGPTHQQCGPKFGGNSSTFPPQFHLKDSSCFVNDPNGLFYDVVHSMYHFMYQNGLFEPADGHGQGPVWGHAVSRDLIKWAHLPVSIWNDRLYDERAIFTGSATVVNGKPYLVYPGLCVKGRQPDCNSGTILALAVPANDSDPFYTQWKKLDALNPIVNNTGRDPTTAWLTDAGEWRMVTYDKQLHVSSDFLHWTNPGASALPSGECPSLFPLPGRYNDGTDESGLLLDSRAGGDAAAPPTHVFKHSYNPPGPDQGQDVMLVGTWIDGARGTTGSWTPYKPNASKYASIGQVIDNGYTYASKDFYDRPNDRRIMWGWCQTTNGKGFAPYDWGSAATLAREVRWHGGLEQLIFSPISEQKQLRNETMFPKGKAAMPAKVHANTVLWLGEFAEERAGAQSETLVTFARPSHNVTFGLDVMTGRNKAGANVSTRIYIEYVQGAAQVVVGVREGKFPLTPAPSPSPPSPDQPGLNTNRGILALLPSDDTIELRVFVDQTIVEAYFNDGRVVISSAVIGGTVADKATGVSIFHQKVASSKHDQGAYRASGVEVVVQNANVWSVSSIWVSPEEVLATTPQLPRQHHHRRAVE